MNVDKTQHMLRDRNWGQSVTAIHCSDLIRVTQHVSALNISQYQALYNNYINITSMQHNEISSDGVCN